MKITKQSLVKILSVAVAVALLAVNTVVSFISTAENGEPQPEVYCLPTEQLGYYMGNNATTYPGTDIDIRTNAGRLSGEALEAAAPRLSKKGEGYNGSYAMEVGTTDAYSRYLFKYRLEGAMANLTAVPITIEMKVKMVSGSVNNIYAAQYRSSAPTSYVSPDTYTADDLSATEWTTLKFTRTETAGKSRWMYIFITSDENGAVLLIDEIRVYLASAPQTNYLIGEYIYLNQSNSVPYTSFPTNVGDFDVTFTKNPTIDFDNTVERDYIYAPISELKCYTKEGNPAISTSVIPTISASGDGVKGSYAMELATTESGSEKLYLQPASLSEVGKSIRPSTTYNVKFKVRVKSGIVKAFESGIFENGNRGFISAFKAYGVELSNEWQCYSFDVTTTDVTNQWRKLAFHYSTGDGGAVVQLDDIEVFRKNSDDSLTPIDFTHSSIYNQGTIGSYDTKILKSTSLPFDNNVDPDAHYAPVPIKYYTKEGKPEISTSVIPTVSASGDGVKGSYAMELNTTEAGNEKLYLQPTSYKTFGNGFMKNATYTVNFKVRVKSGTVKHLEAGIYENGGSVGFISGLYLYGVELSDEWQSYTFDTTTTDTELWRRLAFYYSTGEGGAVIQFDDVEVFEQGENNALIPIQFNGNGTIGSYDTLIQSVEYTTAQVDNTPDGLAYYPIYFEDWTDAFTFDKNNKKVYTNKIADTVPTIFNDGLADDTVRETSRNTIIPRLECNSGVKNSYAFVMGDISVPYVFAYETGLRYSKTNQLKDNTEYTFNVKIKKEGTVDVFKMGIRESYATGTIHYALQLTDSEMSNDWVEYTFKYTTNGACTGNYSEIFFSYSSATGAKIYIDDVYMYISSDKEKNQCFTWSDFDYTDLGQAEKVVLSTDFPENFAVPYFAPTTNSDKTVIKAEPEKGIEGFEGIGNIANVKNYNGNGVLAIGFNEHNSNVEFRQNLSASKPGGTYRISFKILVQGEDVQRCRTGVLNSWGRYEYYNAGANFNQYEHGKWTEVSYTWTDPANYISATNYRYFVLEFIGGAGTGVLLDDLKITYVSDDWGGNAPNIIDYGSFGTYKTEKPKLVWSDIFTYKEEKK